MASNPKYGVTYKTADGKTKTISGINLGTGSYSDEQITAFIGILATATNKEVLSVDVTTANAIPAPEPAPPQQDLITTLIVEPAEVTITAGESSTAEILITTDPEDAVYSLSAPAAPEWVSIDDTTLVYTPAATTPAEDYQITVRAATNDDQKETTTKVNILQPKKTPDFNLYCAGNYNTAKATVTATTNSNGTMTLLMDGKQRDAPKFTFNFIGSDITASTVTGSISETETFDSIESAWSLRRSRNSGSFTVEKIK